MDGAPTRRGIEGVDRALQRAQVSLKLAQNLRHKKMDSSQFVWTQDTRVVDLSHSLDDQMSFYPGDPVFQCHPVSTVKDDGCAVTAISFGSHTGTHLDAPCHFIEGGQSVEKIDLSLLQGLAAVVNIPNLEPGCNISRADFIAAFTRNYPSSSLSDFRIVLVMTGWCALWGKEEYMQHPFLNAEIAETLVESGIKVVGIDALSPDATGGSNDFSFHKIFLGNGGIIVENLTNLGSLCGKKIFASLLPLKLKGTST